MATLSKALFLSMTQYPKVSADLVAQNSLRGQELDNCSVVQTELDRLVGLAADLCQRPIALVSFCQGDHLCLVAQQGWPITSYNQTPHSLVFDGHVQRKAEPLHIEDASNEPQFYRLPHIASRPYLRAYTGIPLIGDRLGLMGVLSVLDTQPQPASPRVMELLRILSHEIVGLVGDRPAEPTWRIPPAAQQSRPMQALVPSPVLTDVKQQNLYLRLLQHLNYELQLGASIRKAGPLIAQVLPQLFPDSSGWVLLCDGDCQVFKSLALWGNTAYRSDCLLAKHCWAVQSPPKNLEESTQACTTCRDASQRWVHCCLPLRVADQTIGVLSLRFPHIGALQPDVRQRAEMVASHLALSLSTLQRLEALEQENLLDPLTGLYNRRYMTKMLADMLHRASHGNVSVAIIMVDIDFFKRFNDTYGHLAGDQVLRDFSVFLKGFIRSTDIACRYGGEEFLLLLSNANQATAYRRAERLRHDTRYLTMKYQGKSLGNITVSAGVATFPDHAKTGNALIWAADMALYRAKSSGRDRVVLADASDCPPPKEP